MEHAESIVKLLNNQFCLGPEASSGVRSNDSTLQYKTSSSEASSCRGIRLYGRSLLAPVEAKWDISSINGYKFYSSSDSVCSFTPTIDTESHSLTDVLASTESWPVGVTPSTLESIVDRELSTSKQDFLTPIQDIDSVCF